MRTDGQTDMTKLTVAFRNFANASKNEKKNLDTHISCLKLTCSVRIMPSQKRVLPRSRMTVQLEAFIRTSAAISHLNNDATVQFTQFQQDATVYQNFISYLYEAQHVSGDTPPIVRSLKLH